MHRPLLLLFILTLLVLVGGSRVSPVFASTITVNSTDFTAVLNDGKCTLIKAMENARNGNQGYPDCAAGSSSNVIELPTNGAFVVPGAWTGGGTSGAIALPIVTRTLTIDGNGSTFTHGSSAGSFRLFYVLTSSLTVNNVTIQGMVLPDGADGAVYNDNGALTINSSKISGTRVASGGSGGGAVTSRACTSPAASCTASNRASLNVADSAFDDNQSLSANSAFGAGAGINTFAVGSAAVNTATIIRSRFHDNEATNQGAGVSNAAYDAGSSSTVSIDRSSMTANTTTGGTTPAFGGATTNFVGPVYTSGAANSVATLNITNTTIASNTASGAGFGGGIFNEVDCGFQVSCGGGASARLSLDSVTVYGNSSGRDANGTGQGGGIWSNNNDPTGSITLSVRDSIIAGNTANATADNCHLVNTPLSPVDYNIASDSSCGTSFAVFTTAQINLASLNFSGFTYYQAPQAGSVAIDRTSCDVSVDQIGTPRPLGNACEAGAIEVNLPSGRHVPSDFNGDSRSDPGIFRPSASPNALWYSTPSGGGAAFQIFFGANGDIPVPGDYDGDGKTDAVIWRPSTGLWYGPRTGAPAIVTQFIMGQNGDIPVPCDYDGDGAVDPAFYRPSTGQWFGTRANGSTVVLNTNLGLVAGDIPVPADYDGDGKCDPAIMRPGVGPGGTNLWYAVLSGGGTFQIYFGAPGDIPVPADYDGDGKADAVIFRPSTGLWYGPKTGAAAIVTQISLGQNGDIPIPADYNGDGAAEPAIYRPSSGLFFGVTANGQTVTLNTNLGLATGDIPTGKRPSYPGVYPFSPPVGSTAATPASSPLPTSAPPLTAPRATPLPASSTATAAPVRSATPAPTATVLATRSPATPKPAATTGQPAASLSR